MKTKPFPWKCSGCRECKVWLDSFDFQTTVEHDGRPYGLTIRRLKAPKCRNCGKIVMTDEVNRQVSDALRASAGLLTPEEIQKKRSDLRLSQKQLADYLQVADATISRWETGAQIQQRSLDGLMRLFFELREVRAFLDRLHVAKSTKRPPTMIVKSNVS